MVLFAVLRVLPHIMNLETMGGESEFSAGTNHFRATADSTSALRPRLSLARPDVSLRAEGEFPPETKKGQS